jgi:hypothetical protein
MKTIFAALASVSVLAVSLALSPTVAAARGGGGGFHGAGGFRGAGYHDGGIRFSGFRGDGFRGDGFRDRGLHDRGFRGRGSDDRGFRGGFFDDDYLFDDALPGLAFADAGFYDDPGFYGAYAYGPPYPADAAPFGYDDGGAGAPPPTYQSRWDQSQSGKNCGSSVWDADQYKYNWTSC